MLLFIHPMDLRPMRQSRPSLNCDWQPEASLNQCSKTFYPSIEVKPLHLPALFVVSYFRIQVSVCHFTKELCPLVTLADKEER